MSHPKTAWKFKLWTDAMLRGAQVGDPDYKSKRSKSTGSKVSQMTKKMRKRRRRRKRRLKDA